MALTQINIWLAYLLFQNSHYLRMQAFRGTVFIQRADDWEHDTIAIHVPAITSHSLRFICRTFAYTAAAHIYNSSFRSLDTATDGRRFFIMHVWNLPSNIFIPQSCSINPTNCISIGINRTCCRRCGRICIVYIKSGAWFT